MTDRIGRIPLTPEQEARYREMSRRQELRLEHLVPIYVMWDDTVGIPEAQASLEGIRDALQASGQKRQLVALGSEDWAENTQEYSGPTWYINTAFQKQTTRRNGGFGIQLDVSEVIKLFYQEPYQQNPHWEVFIVNRDLNDSQDPNINFVFGSTNPTFPASVQSITRLMAQISSQELRSAMIKRLLRHEVGHMFGPPLRTFNIEQKLGPHCTNVCSMRQGLSIHEWANQTIEENRKGVVFCDDCMADFAKVRDRYKPIP